MTLPHPLQALEVSDTARRLVEYLDHAREGHPDPALAMLYAKGLADRVLGGLRALGWTDPDPLPRDEPPWPM